MTNKERAELLKQKHRQFDTEIKQKYSRYIDDTDLKKMKIEKLKIKEQIEKLEWNDDYVGGVEYFK